MKIGAAISTLLTSLYAVYKAESNANDSLATYNGTAQGGLTYSGGKSGNAFTFNGTNAYVSLPDDSLNISSVMSFSFWLKTSATSGEGIIIGNMNNARSPYSFAHGFNIWFSNLTGTGTGKIQLDWRSGANINKTITSTSSVNNNAWRHIAITYDTSNTTTGSKIYIDGVLDKSGQTLDATGTSSIHYTTPMKSCIGANNLSGTVSNYIPSSSLDEVCIWNKVLTATEVTELYNAGTGKFYPY